VDKQKIYHFNAMMAPIQPLMLSQTKHHWDEMSKSRHSNSKRASPLPEVWRERGKMLSALLCLLGGIRYVRQLRGAWETLSRPPKGDAAFSS
jgi:hypothetical protein